MVTLELQVPEDILFILGRERPEFAAEVRVLAAINLYAQKRLSLGKAAELAGISKWDFIQAVSRQGIPAIDYDPAELREEIEFLRSRAD